MRTIMLIEFILISYLIHGQSELPKWGQDRINSFNDKYVQVNDVSPRFLETDFSGDGSVDLAILIERRTDKKKGILIFFAGSNKSFVIGAGNTFLNVGDDFKWANEWSVFKSKVAYETTFKPDGDIAGERKIILERHAIFIKEDEGSGGLIYFDGKEFIWIHQGD